MSVQNVIAAACLVSVSLFGTDVSHAAEQDKTEQEKAAVFSVLQAIANTWNDGHVIARSYFESSPTIIDNTPPYRFQGPHAVEDWIEAYRNSRPKGSEDAKTSLHLLQPQSVEIKSTHAYIAVPADWRVEQNGQSEVSHGMITAILDEEDQHWRVAAWVWTPR